MKKALILLVLGMVRSVALGAGGPAPELVRVIDGLQPVVAALLPKPEVKMNGDSSLMISYQAQTFKVHSNLMTGEFSRETHDEIGPAAKGFVLFVDVQPKGEVNQAMTPQTLRRPYWQTYIEVTPIAGSDKQLYWSLSFGSHTDSNLLSQIRKALNDLPNARPKVKRTG